MAFCGLGDSYEQYYQAIRRCYRFGQTRPVHAHMVLSERGTGHRGERPRQGAAARETAGGLVAAIAAGNRRELFCRHEQGRRLRAPAPPDPARMAKERIMTDRIMDQARAAEWVLYNGDSAEVLPGLPDASVDLAVFSPPFSSTYTYSPSDRDLGNVRNDDLLAAVRVHLRRAPPCHAAGPPRCGPRRQPARLSRTLTATPAAATSAAT